MGCRITLGSHFRRDTRWAEEMKLLAAQLGIEARVRLVGHRDDVASIYACADILLAPSRREALSLTLLEAAAFAMPIAATDVGGIGETGLGGYPVLRMDDALRRLRGELPIPSCAVVLAFERRSHGAIR